jgi:hypothetical protein
MFGALIGCIFCIPNQGGQRIPMYPLAGFASEPPVVAKRCIAGNDRNEKTEFQSTPMFCLADKSQVLYLTCRLLADQNVTEYEQRAT